MMCTKQWFGSTNIYSMKILIDINHPAHVHYFKNFIKIMKKRGADVLVVARDRDMVISLLEAYNIEYVNRGTGANGFVGKLIYMIKADIFMLRLALKFKPDLFLSFGTPYAAQTATLLNKFHIAITDNDYAGRFTYWSVVPFSKYIITSQSAFKNFGKKHVKVDSNIKLLYLHPNYYRQLDKSYLNYLNIGENEKYIIVRFVAYNAYHDWSFGTLSVNQKVELICMLEGYGKVFISSESELPEELKKYSLKIPPTIIHDVIKNASFFIGQSGTMATEAALLGTPSVFIASKNENIDGVLKKFEDISMMRIVRYADKQIDEIKQIVDDSNFRDKAKFYNSVVKPYIAEKIDLTDYLVNFVQTKIKRQ